MKKKGLFFALLICLCAGTTGGSVYAWLIDREEAKNIVRFAGNDIHIQEEFNPPQDPDPGDVIAKRPCITNDSETDVFVRVMVRFSDSDAMEQCEPLSINSGWNLKKDGYYYYDEKLHAGESTTEIFDNIVIKRTVKKEELLPFDVLVYAESVQAYGFSEAQEAFDTL